MGANPTKGAPAGATAKRRRMRAEQGKLERITFHLLRPKAARLRAMCANSEVASVSEVVRAAVDLYLSTQDCAAAARAAGGGH